MHSFKASYLLLRNFNSLSKVLLGLLLVGMSFCVQAQIRPAAQAVPPTIYPTFPQDRPIDSTVAVEAAWNTYLVTDDESLLERIITTAALPMIGIEDAAGPLLPSKAKNDPFKSSRAEVKKSALQHFFISEARWSLSYYIVRNPLVAKIAEKRRKSAKGNEKAVLDFVFTHPPRATTFMGELRMEAAEQQGAKAPAAKEKIAGKKG